MLRGLVIICLLLPVLRPTEQTPIAVPVPPVEDQILLVVSFDSFKEEYLQRGITPNLEKFRYDGLYAKYVENVFPTKTFVNHFTMATGLYSETHGVTGNSLFDFKMGSLHYNSDLFHYRNDTVPIWTLNEKMGGKTGCIMWPGCDFAYDGTNISLVVPYNHSMSYVDRVDLSVKWMTDPKQPVNLMMLYIEDPDYHGHVYSPESDQVRDMIIRVDNLTKYLKDQLETAGVLHRTNIVIVSDHGMETVTPRYFIDINEFVNNSTYKLYGSSPFIQLVPNNADDIDELYLKLSTAAKENGHFKVYKNDELLDRWHVRNDQRVGPISLLADLGYAFQDIWELIGWYEQEFKITVTQDTKFGVHGYDNVYPVMYPIFMAQGPRFKKQHIMKPFSNLDYYEMFCELLQLNPMPNNGSLMHVKDAFIDIAYAEWTHTNLLTILGIVFAVLLIFAIIATVITLHSKKKYPDHNPDMKENCDPIASYSNLPESDGDYP